MSLRRERRSPLTRRLLRWCVADSERAACACAPDELALEALHQAAGDLSRASDALAYSVSQRVPTLWSEEETAELQDSVDAHGTNLRRVHAPTLAA